MSMQARPPYPPHTFAFQPIVDTVSRQIFSYEALIRGKENESAYQVLQQVSASHLHFFDERIRIEAIALAARLGINCHLNLNFLPQSLYSSETAISSTLDAARRYRLPWENIILEVSEAEVIGDHARFAELVNEYRAMGMKVAIDDFGAGYSGLSLLADFQPDQVKLDMKLVHGIESHGPRQAIVRAIEQVCRDLGIDLVAEGVERMEEYLWLSKEGIRFFQGYLFARPAFQCFPSVKYLEDSCPSFS